VSTQWLSSSWWLARGGRRSRCVHFCAIHSQRLPKIVTGRSPAARMLGLHASKVFLFMHSCIILPCAYQAPESLLRLPTSNMTILLAKQAACDLCGFHGSAMQRLPLENWSTIVLWKTWRCGGKGHVQIYVSICVYLCLHLYYIHLKWHVFAYVPTLGSSSNPTYILIYS